MNCCTWHTLDYDDCCCCCYFSVVIDDKSVITYKKTWGYQYVYATIQFGEREINE